jgi:hypothetical protein
MFTGLTNTLKLQINSIRKAIRTNELLRAYYTGRVRVSSKNKAIKDLRVISPDLVDWRIYDHCAAVTRLYSIYEGFVEELLSNWLNLLPDLIPSYVDLNDNIKKTHRIGVGQLLQDIEKNRYQNITPNQVVSGYYNGLSGIAKYELFPKVFLMHDQNLRKDALVKIFTNSGISDLWAWVENYKEIRGFLRDIRGNNSTVEAEIRTLVDYRNEASHGYEVDTLLNDNELLEMADFIEIFCNALSELVTYEVMQIKKNKQEIIILGRITETFKNGAVVAQIEQGNVSIGDEVYLSGKSWCRACIINSIQLNDVNQEKVTITERTEVGFRFDIEAKRNLELLYVK